MTGEFIPSTAWVQAVFVCLFIVLIVWLLGWMSKRDESYRTFQKEESDSNRRFQQEESNKWQSFIYNLNESWQKQNKEQREENSCAMADVNKSITNLTKVTEGLVMEVKEMRAESRQFSADLHDHDIQAKEILNIVAKPSRSSRTKQE